MRAGSEDPTETEGTPNHGRRVHHHSDGGIVQGQFTPERDQDLEVGQILADIRLDDRAVRIADSSIRQFLAKGLAIDFHLTLPASPLRRDGLGIQHAQTPLETTAREISAGADADIPAAMTYKISDLFASFLAQAGGFRATATAGKHDQVVSLEPAVRNVGTLQPGDLDVGALTENRLHRRDAFPRRTLVVIDGDLDDRFLRSEEPEGKKEDTEAVSHGFSVKDAGGRPMGA